jgi:hypothetical protein
VLEARLTTLICKIFVVLESENPMVSFKTNLAKSFKKGHSSKRAVLQVVVMIMMTLREEITWR